MKKVSILSYTKTSNYGGLLQIYALSKILSDKNDVSVIVYNNSSSVQRSKLRNFLAFLYNRVFRFLSTDKKRKQNEQHFRELIPFTQEEFNNAQQLSEIHSDYFVVGSDQVWNPYLNGFDKAYLLDFKTSGKKLSYAASFGIEDIPQRWLVEIKKSLMCFEHISLREQTGLNIVDNVSALEPISKTVDLDPTLLISKDNWVESFCKTQLTKNKYALVYLMPGDKAIEKKMISFAKKVAKKEKLKLMIVGRKNISKINIFKKGYYHAGPSEFVNLLYHSEFVITNSFHGTAFSVNLNKPFVSFINSSQGSANSLKSRIIDFLQKLSLESRMFDVSKTNNCSVEDYLSSEINFASSDKKLESLRKESLKHLFEYIDDEK